MGKLKLASIAAGLALSSVAFVALLGAEPTRDEICTSATAGPSNALRRVRPAQAFYAPARPLRAAEYELIT
jgi:hypothetical protein